MADATMFHESDLAWAGAAPGGVMERSGGRSRHKMLGDRALGLYVNMGQYDPGVVIAAHSHSQNELMYIVDGDVTIGDRYCPAGTVLRVPANTVYGPLTAGPQGTRFLTVRPGPTTTHIPEPSE